MESEKHLAPLDSYSLSLSSIQDMRQSLAQFMDESTVSDYVVSNVERMKRKKRVSWHVTVPG